MVTIHGLSESIVHFLCRFTVLMWLTCDVMWHKLLLRYRLLHWRAADIHNVFGHTSRVRPHVPPVWDFMQSHLRSGITHSCFSSTHSLLWCPLYDIGPMASFSLILFDIISPSLCSPFLHNPPPFLCPLLPVPTAQCVSPVTTLSSPSPPSEQRGWPETTHNCFVSSSTIVSH